MPLVRSEVRNEFRLGDPELYKGAAAKKDPKALLDGVAVAGLVGILRQLGDLAEFASDVFHDLHEQVITTAARGRKVLNRVHNIEAALPSIEKAVQGQTSHIHLAYVAGSDWHAHISTEKSHLLSSELPRYMMDSYEECRDLPRLYLLDKFDSAGTGACLNRYSDPSYFRKMSNMSRMEKAENVQREQKIQKHKKRGSSLRNGELRHALSASGVRNGEFELVLSTPLQNSRRFASPSTDGQSLYENRSPDLRSNPELPSRSSSFGSKTRLSFVDQVVDAIHSATPDEIGHRRFSDVKLHDKPSFASTSVLHEEIRGDVSNDGSKHDSLHGQSVPESPPITWVEKTEIVMLPNPVSCDDVVIDMVEDLESTNLSSLTSTDYGRLNSAIVPVSSNDLTNLDEDTSETENYMDALNTMEPETEAEEAECQTKTEVKFLPNFSSLSILVKDRELSDTEALDASHTPLDEHGSPRSLDAVITYDSSQLSPPPCVIAASPYLHSSTLDDASKDGAHDDSRKNTDNSSHLPSPPCVVADLPDLYSSTLDDASKEVARDDSCDDSRKNTDNNSHLPSPPCVVADSPDLYSSTLDDASKEGACDDSRKNTDNGYVFNPPFEPSIADVETVLGDETVAKELTAIYSPPSGSQNTSRLPSTKLWTNAGLFGLEPSKPPDLSSLNVAVEDVTSGFKESNNASGMANGVVSISSIICEKMDERPCSSSKTSSSADLPQARLGGVIQPNDPSSCPSSLCSSQHDELHGKLILSSKLDNPPAKPANRIHACSNGTDLISNDPAQSTANISSSFSSLAQRFLANTLQRKASSSYADSSASSQAVTSNARKSDRSFSLGNCNVVSQASSQQRKESSLHASSKMFDCSEQSSPPLEYMKISFHPMNVSETSKLKLEFSDGNPHESADDLMYPTFQLLPGSAFPLPDSASESDDDTFCRSYNYSSEDLLSPHLYSNSELWDQDERPFEERELSPLASVSGYRAFEQGKTSSMNRVREFTEPDAESTEVPFESFAAVDLPALDSLITMKNQEIGDYSSHNLLSSSLEDQTQMPPPPPLPPMQWRIMKSPTASGEDKSTTTKDNIIPSNDLQPPCFAQQQGQVPIPPSVHGMNKVEMLDRNQETHHASNGKEMTAREALTRRIGSKPDLRKMNRPEKPRKDTIDTKTSDEREELLLQIRNKSFNLRRTTMSKPSITSETTANSNVTAILEKANAIRQAFVGSDEGGDDDNWSDV